MTFDLGEVRFSFLWKHTGLVTIGWRWFGLHIGVRRRSWVWGYEESWYDGPWPTYGLGPLFLFNYYLSLRYSAEREES